MNEIRFNRNYKKLHNQKKGYLVYVDIVHYQDLSPEFIKYDTDGRYKLQNNHEYMILYFLGDKHIPFTTLRKYNQDNLNRYSRHRDEFFKIIVEEGKNGNNSRKD